MNLDYLPVPNVGLSSRPKVLIWIIFPSQMLDYLPVPKSKFGLSSHPKVGLSSRPKVGLSSRPKVGLSSRPKITRLPSWWGGFAPPPPPDSWGGFAPPKKKNYGGFAAKSRCNLLPPGSKLHLWEFFLLLARASAWLVHFWDFA